MTMPLPRPKRKKKGADGGSGTLRADREKAGLTGGGGDIHDLPPEDGELLDLDPSTISPNPMNMRLELRDMEPMIADVRERGVHTPGIVMHTKVFIECYPNWSSRVKYPERQFILGPGHRRHAAALATGRLMPAVLRDDLARERRVEEELVSENNSRDGLSPIEQALAIDLLRERVHEDEDRILSFDEVVERAGYTAGTVSKYLALLKLPQDVQRAIHVGDLSMRGGYSLSLLKDPNGSKESEEAHALQLRGWGLMRAEGLSVEAAKNRLALEERKQVHARKPRSVPVPVPDQREESSAQAGKVQNPPDGTPEAVKSSAGGGESPQEASEAAVAVAVAAAEGTKASESEVPETTAVDPEVFRKAAADQRDMACRLLLAEDRYAKSAESSVRLVTAVLNPNEWRQAAAKAHGWLLELQKGPSSKKRPGEYFAAVAASDEPNLMHRAAFAIGLAADEVRAAQLDRDWDARDVAHVQFLATSRASYQLTEWEQQQIERVSRVKQ